MMGEWKSLPRSLHSLPIRIRIRKQFLPNGSGKTYMVLSIPRVGLVIVLFSCLVPGSRVTS